MVGRVDVSKKMKSEQGFERANTWQEDIIAAIQEKYYGDLDLDGSSRDNEEEPKRQKLSLTEKARLRRSQRTGKV